MGTTAKLGRGEASPVWEAQKCILQIGASACPSLSSAGWGIVHRWDGTQAPNLEAKKGMM